VIECLRGVWLRRFFLRRWLRDDLAAARGRKSLLEGYSSMVDATEAAAGPLKNQLLNDMLAGIAHPFPLDMEETMRRIVAHDPALIDNLDHRYFSGWNAGQDLNAGRALLQAITNYVSTKTGVTPA
jgi:hypothetical protein